MKKILLYIPIMLGLLLVGCDPMEDINKEIDNAYNEAYVLDTFIINREIAPYSYVLTDEDYELSSNESVAKYKNFSSSVLPKDYLPEILNKKFVASNAFEMQVTYDYYSKPIVDMDNAYVIDTAEYAELGQSYPNFSDEDVAKSLIGKMLDRKIYADEAGAEMTVHYTLYGSGDTRYIKVNSDKTTEVLAYKPDGVYTLTDADYEAVGSGKYKNFNSIEEAEKKVVELAILKKHELPKDYACTVYRNNYDKYVVYLYDGANWVVKQSVMPTTEPLNYALDLTDIVKSTWWADPAIKIALGADDYALFTETGKYLNFDLRSGQTPGTDKAKLIEMLGTMLDTNHNPIEDQQYLVSFAYYDGSNGVGTLRLIKTSGVWSEYSN